MGAGATSTSTSALNNQEFLSSPQPGDEDVKW